MKTIGSLISVVGATLMVSAVTKRVTPEVAFLGIGSAIALGAADVIYAARGRISPVYLADSVVEAAFVTGWALQQPWKRNSAPGGRVAAVSRFR